MCTSTDLHHALFFIYFFNVIISIFVFVANYFLYACFFSLMIIPPPVFNTFYKKNVVFKKHNLTKLTALWRKQPFQIPTFAISPLQPNYYRKHRPASFFSRLFTKEIIPFWSVQPQKGCSFSFPSLLLLLRLRSHSFLTSALYPLITPRSILIPGKAITERLLPINIPASSSSSRSNNNKQTRNVGERNDHNLRRSGANRYICFGYRTARKNAEIYCFSWKSHLPSLFYRLLYVLVYLCLCSARVNDLHYIAIAAVVLKRWDVRRSFGCSGSQEILCGLRSN